VELFFIHKNVRKNVKNAFLFKK